MANVPYDGHIFVCTNERPVGHARGDCASKGAANVHAAIKAAANATCQGMNVRVNKSGCLDVCESGVAVVAYPSGRWYGGVTPQHAAEIVTGVLSGRGGSSSPSEAACPVQRLDIPKS